MNIPWGRIISIAGRVAGTVLTGVPAIEKFTKQLGGASGATKAGAVLELALAELQAASVIVGRDLSVDPRVLAAIGNTIDAVAELHNALAAAARDGG